MTVRIMQLQRCLANADEATDHVHETGVLKPEKTQHTISKIVDNKELIEF